MGGETDRPGDSSWTLAAKSALREQLDQHARSLTTALLGDDRTAEDLGTRHGAAVARFEAVRAAARSALLPAERTNPYGHVVTG
jgi:hypothetical protein